MIFGTIFTFIAGAASVLAGLCAIAELVKLYDDGEIPQHVCVGAGDYEPLKSTCNTWQTALRYFSFFSELTRYSDGQV